MILEYCDVKECRCSNGHVTGFCDFVVVLTGGQLGGNLFHPLPARDPDFV